MFMFRKKNTTVSTSTGLQLEAKKFQEAVSEINNKYNPNDLTISILGAYAEKAGVDISFLADTYMSYLKNNALNAIRKVKASDNYTVLNLEQAAVEFGFELDDLEVTFFSVE